MNAQTTSGEPFEVDLSESGREIRPLSADDVRLILSQEIDDSSGQLGSEVSELRRQAIRYYEGKPFGNEVPGRSQVVLNDLADTVEWAMPSFMRMFWGPRTLIRAVPAAGRDSEEAREKAKRITWGLNHIVRKWNSGYLLFYEWIKTSLIEMNGFVKVYTDRRVEPRHHVISDLTSEEVEVLLADEDVTILEARRHVELVDGKAVRLFDIAYKRVEETCRIAIDSIPPEEMLLARRLIRLDDMVPFAAQRKKMLASELIAMGFPPDEVINLPRDDSPEWDMERVERHEEDGAFPFMADERVDAASNEVWVTECYARIDEDGDGYSELRKFIVVGEDAIHVLEDVEVERQPFCYLTPIPNPHKFWGRGFSQLVSDLQLIRSTLLRQMLDNLYLSNSPQREAVEGQVNVDDLMVSAPGHTVRVLSPGMLREITVQQFGPMAPAMMEFLQKEKEHRTGIHPGSQYADSQSLRDHTAHGVDRLMAAANARIELIGSIFAETGFKQLAKMLYYELVTGGHKKFQIEVSGEVVEIDPDDLDGEFEFEIDVGLGVGQALQRVSDGMTLLDLQGQLHDRGYGGYLVNAQNVYNALCLVTEGMQFTAPGEFFQNPKNVDPPPPTPPHQVQVEQIRQEMEAEKLKLDSAKLELETLRERNIVEHRAEEMVSQERLERYRIEKEYEARIEVARIQAEATMDAARERTRAAEKKKDSNGSGEPAH